MTEAAIDLVALGDDVEWTDAGSAARVRLTATPVPGRLGELVEWLASTQGRLPVVAPKNARCVVLGPVSDAVASLADDLGVHVRELAVDDHGSAERAFALGVRAADDEIDSGADLLVIADPDASVAAALLVAVLTDIEPVGLLPRGAAAVDTRSWIADAHELRDGRRRLLELRHDPSALLAALGHVHLVTTVALVMRAVSRRTGLVLDGAAAVAAAVLCQDVQARAGRWWQVADTGSGTVLRRAAAELGRQPLLDLGHPHGDGTAGLLTIPLLRAAAGRAGGLT